MLRATTYGRKRSGLLVGRAARAVVSLIDKLTGCKFVQASDVVDRAVRCFGESYYRKAALNTVSSEPDEFELKTAAALADYLTYHNTICWNVECAHVAKYLDKSYAQYFEHESFAVKLLPALIGEQYEDYAQACGQARKLLADIRQAYESDQAQGTVSPTRAVQHGESEEETLP